MARGDDHETLFDVMDEELRAAPGPTEDIFSNIIANACIRVPILRRVEMAAGLVRSIGAGAWTDAAIALIELEMPTWRIRRLSYENGEWLCSLSRRPNAPVEFDDPADATHALMPLAILRAFLVARRSVSAMAAEARTIAPQAQPTPEGMLCCDNFA